MRIRATRTANLVGLAAVVVFTAWTQDARAGASMAPLFQTGWGYEAVGAGQDLLKNDSGDAVTSYMSEPHYYIIEVPYEAHTNNDAFILEIWDPAIGSAGTAGPAGTPYDIVDPYTEVYDTSVCYTLYSPDLDPDAPDSEPWEVLNINFLARNNNERNCLWLTGQEVADGLVKTNAEASKAANCTATGSEFNCCDLLAGDGKWLQFIIADPIPGTPSALGPEPGHWILEVDTTPSCDNNTDYKHDDISAFKLRAYTSLGTQLHMYTDFITLAAADSSLGLTQHPEVQDRVKFRYYPMIPGGPAFGAFIYNVDTDGLGKPDGGLQDYELSSNTWRFDPEGDGNGPTDVTPETLTQAGSERVYGAAVVDYRYGKNAGLVSAVPDQGNSLWTLGQQWNFVDPHPAQSTDALFVVDPTEAPKGIAVATIWFEYGGNPDNEPVRGDGSMRIYLPDDPDNFALPFKPFLTQYLVHVGRENPPSVGKFADYDVYVLMTNHFQGRGPIYFGHAPSSFVDATLNTEITGNIVKRTGAGRTYPIVDFGTIAPQVGAGVRWHPGVIPRAGNPGGTPPNNTQAIGVVYRMEVERKNTDPIVYNGTGTGATRATWRDETSKPLSDGIEPFAITNPRGTSGTGDTDSTESDGSDSTPTMVSVTDVHALAWSNNGAVEWRTASEVGTLAFRVSRLDRISGDLVPVNDRWVPSEPGRDFGGIYRLADSTLVGAIGTTVSYVIEEADLFGRFERHGPFELTVEAAPTPLPLGEDGWSSEIRPLHEFGALPPLPQPVNRAARLSTWQTTSGRHPAALIEVVTSGLYRIRADSVATALAMSPAEVQAGIDAGSLRLSRGGNVVAYRPTSDGLLFFAHAGGSIYAAHGAYRLEPGDGLMIQGRASPMPAAPALATSFAAYLNIEEDHRAAPAVSPGFESSYWQWTYLVAGSATTGSATFELPVQALATGGAPAELKVHLLGGSVSSAVNDHHVVVSLNGVDVAEQWFKGKAPHQVIAQLPSGVLVEGSNSVEVRALLDSEVPYGIVYVDRFTLRYERSYTTVDGQAVVVDVDDGDGIITVDGVASTDVLVLDLSNASVPRAFDNLLISAGSGGSRVSFDTQKSRGPFLVANEADALTPVAVYPAPVSGLLATTHAVDYLVIAGSALVSAARELADLRSEQGLASMVVDVQDVYDDFADGIADPRAVAQFMRYAGKHWAKGPTYVALVGDGSFDHRDVMGHGDNLVSPMLTRSIAGLFASDSRLGDLRGNDGAPEVVVGRIPVITADELTAYIGKIRSFEAGRGEAWASRALVVTDDPDEGGDYVVDAAPHQTLLEASYDVTRIDLEASDIDQARSELLAALSAGTRMVHYVGHGGMDRLAAEGLLTIADVDGLTNTGMTPILFAASCLQARFEVPGNRTLSERLVLAPDTGTIAVIGSAGLEYSEDSSRITRSMLESMSVVPVRRLGDVFRIGLRDSLNHEIGRDSRQLFNLIGDPALELNPAPAAIIPHPIGSPEGCDCGATGGSAAVALLLLAAYARRSRRRRRVTPTHEA